MKESNYVNEFKVPLNVTTRAHKTSVTFLQENSLRLGENDECEYLLGGTTPSYKCVSTDSSTVNVRNMVKHSDTVQI